MEIEEMVEELKKQIKTIKERISLYQSEIESLNQNKEEDSIIYNTYLKELQKLAEKYNFELEEEFKRKLEL